MSVPQSSIRELSEYPFGMIMPGRSYDGGSGYRYGFNGKELDEKGVGGGLSTQDYGFRIYNPQLGKFLSVDPLTKDYPWYTPYQFAGNKPIWAIDLDGLEEFIKTNYIDASGNLYRTEIQVVKGYGAESGKDHVQNQLVHINEVHIDENGNATGTYLGSINGSWDGNLNSGRGGSTAFDDSENNAVWSSQPMGNSTPFTLETVPDANRGIIGQFVLNNNNLTTPASSNNGFFAEPPPPINGTGVAILNFLPPPPNAIQLDIGSNWTRANNEDRVNITMFEQNSPLNFNGGMDFSKKNTLFGAGSFPVVGDNVSTLEDVPDGSQSRFNGPTLTNGNVQ